VIKVAALITVLLGALLLCKSSLVGAGALRLGFLLGLGGSVALLVLGDSWDWRTPRFRSRKLAGTIFAFLAAVPYLLLLETGIAGYRGFSSSFRYVSLGLGILGGVGLVAALVVPKLLPRMRGPAPKNC
jgi:hypothetical protein